MNDPHVVALRYRVHHHDRVDYSKAGPLSFDASDFHVDVRDQKVRFELKSHYATKEDARRTVEPFIQNWEFDSSLRRDPGCFRLERPSTCPQDFRRFASKRVTQPSGLGFRRASRRFGIGRGIWVRGRGRGFRRDIHARGPLP